MSFKTKLCDCADDNGVNTQDFTDFAGRSLLDRRGLKPIDFALLK